MNKSIARKTAGSILTMVGLVFTSILIGTYWDDLDGIIRTGYVGITIFSGMLISGLYISFDGRLQLVLRVIWTILLIPGFGLALFFLISAAFTGNIYVFIFTLSAIIVFYGILIITTIYGLYEYLS